MYSIEDLMNMGFTAEDIQDALDSGCTNLDQVLDLLTNSKSNTLKLRPELNKDDTGSNAFPVYSVSDGFKQEMGSDDTNSTVESRIINTPEDIVMEIQRKEAEETRKRLAEEKRLDAELKERLKKEIEEDRKNRAKKNQVEPIASSSSEQKPNTDKFPISPDQNYVFKLSIAQSKPVLIKLPNTSNLGDLCGEIQKFILNIKDCSSRNLASDCITITQGDWPRKPFAKPQSNADRLVKLTDLGFPHHCPLFLDHKKCINAAEPEPPIESVVPPAPMEVSDEDSDVEMPEMPPLPLLPGEFPLPGNNPVVAPAGNTLGGASAPDSSAANAARSAFLSRFESGSTAFVSSNAVEVRKARGSVPTLTDIALERIIRSIIKVASAMSSHMCPLDNNDVTEKAHKEDVFLTTEARHFFWPPDLACRLIENLKQSKSFTQKVAVLFKNLVDRLELDYYPLVTGDMLSIFAKHWPDLCILKLNGLQDGQVSPTSLLKIAQLRHLKELYLNGVRSVNDDNISSLATLPNLRVLDVGRTRVTDVGWHRMMAPACPTLERLDVTGMSEGNLDYVGIKPILPPALTDAGFHHILKLFPALNMLTVSKTNITGTEPANLGVINTQLETLVLSDCEKLASLPVWLSSVKEFKLSANVPLTFDIVFENLKRFKQSSRVEKIVGLFSLDSFCREAFLRLVQLNLHLTEFNFSTCGKDWLTLPILLEFLRCMVASEVVRTSIRELVLPYKIFRYSESNANELVDILSEFKQLNHLNFGNQLSYLHVYSLEPLFRQLCRLTSVTITHGIEKDVERIRVWLPTGCKLKVLCPTHAS